MKKNFSFLMLFVCLTLTSPVYGWFGPFSALSLMPTSFAVEGRVAYFHPTSSRVREIYSNGWADYELEVSAGLGCSNFRLWGGVWGFSKHGHSSYFHNKTTLDLVPINLGLKYVFPLTDCFDIYVGGAACYSILLIHDHSPYVKQRTRKEAFGGLAQSGIKYYFWNCAYLCAFFDYYFQEFHFKKHEYLSDSRFVERNNLDMSGYKVGLGGGFSF